MTILKILLLPFSFLFGLIILLRNLIYDKNFLSVTVFQIPVISIGNLTTGGTGKSPMTEYLIRLLSVRYKIATLSRGYGRKTNGFHWVENSSPTSEVGDEPKMFKTKFPEVLVSVDEKRVSGIKKILSQFPTVQVILLDDAFQHRAIKPSCNILLMDYKDIFKVDFMLPSGNLREWKSGKNRADILVVTKCPPVFSPIEERRFEKQIKKSKNQKLFFSYLKYGDLISADSSIRHPMFNKEYYFSRDYSVLLFSGIANPKPLYDYLEDNAKEVVKLRFMDHHDYTYMDLKLVKEKFDTIVNKNKIIVTTEKDFIRINNSEFDEYLHSLPLFILPVEVAFHSGSQGDFDNAISAHLNTFNSTV